MTRGEMQWAELESAWPSLKDEGNLARDTRLLADKASRAASRRLRGESPVDSAVLDGEVGDDQYRCLALSFLLLVRDTFDAVVTVLGRGLLIQSQVLLRTAFEAVTQLLYMSKDPVARGRQFIAFASQEKRRFLEGVKRVAGEAGIEVAEEEPPCAQAECAAINSTDLRPQRRIQRNWHGMSFKKLLDQVCEVEPGWKGYYEILYVPASQLAHSSTAAVRQYRHLDPDAAQFVPSKGTRSARMVLLFASYLLLRSSAVLEEACSLGLGDPLREVDRRFNEMALARKNGGEP